MLLNALEVICIGYRYSRPRPTGIGGIPTLDYPVLTLRVDHLRERMMPRFFGWLMLYE
jgi:hypothetical protein